MIQDCLGWAYEYIHQCHKSREEMLVIKLDFEKAFDKIKHQSTIDILRAKGFGEKWISWTKNIFKSASSAVMLNGVPGKKFVCKKGVRQGDHVSPLFVLAADLLQFVENDMHQKGELQLPIPCHNKEYPIVRYAVDT